MAVYTEYLVEFDNDNLVVYLSGLDKDGFWIELMTFDEVNSPEDFAEGYAQRMKDQGLFVTTIPTEWEIEDDLIDEQDDTTS